MPIVFTRAVSSSPTKLPERGLLAPPLLNLLVSEVSAGFIDLPAAELGRGIDLALKCAGETLELDRCMVGLFVSERSLLQIVHGWAGDGPCPPPGRLLAVADYPWVFGCIFAGREVLCESIASGASEARPVLQRLAGDGLTALVVLPLRIGRELRGLVAFASTRGAHKWVGDVLTGMRLTVEIIASAIDRQQKDEQLRARQAFDSLIAQLSRAFIKAPVASLDEVLPAVLADVGQTLRFDRAAIFRCDPATGRSRLWHEWVAPAHSDPRRAVLPEAQGATSDWPPICAERECEREWSIADIEKLAPQAPLYQRIKEYGRGTLALGPLSGSGQQLGVLVLHTAQRRSFSDDFRRQLTLLGELFASAIARMEGERARERAYKELQAIKSQLERERDYLREKVRSAHGDELLLGKSPAMQAVFRITAAVAATHATTLIRGESGVGKELVARAIHSQSARKDGPLIKVNCASIPRDLFESEFFGHVRGSFTGAHRDRAGRFELADRGTIFLDEVGEIPLDLQAKLLRVLQEGEYERIGEDRTRKANVRVIAATNRELEKDIAAGRFRCDLYYRLNTFPIEVPPLRERGDDVLGLARHFLGIYCRSAGKGVPPLTPEHELLLSAYHWPGNVRELQQVIERAVILTHGSRLRLDLALPKPSASHSAPDVTERPAALPRLAHFPLTPLPMTELKRLERENILAALARTGWQIAGPGGAAELLGLKPSTLRDRVRALGIDRGR